MHMRKSCFCLISLLIFSLLCTGCGARKTQDQNAMDTNSDILQQAETLFQNGAYEESLEQYLTAMEKDLKDMNARIGVAKCQIALGNYEIADMNLTIAQQVQPGAVEICEMYLKMSQASNNVRYAQIAVDLASQYGHASILENVPAAPAMDQEPGNSAGRILLTITCADPDAEIYVTLKNSQNSNYDLKNARYSQPIPLFRGENTISAYSVKNGIPSKSVTHTYSVAYDPSEISFKEPLIEEIVRQQLGIAHGPITNYDCEQVTELDWYRLQSVYNDDNEYQNLRIHSLEDLQYLPALTYLNLQYQTEIADFSPLANCPLLYQVNLNACDLTNTEFVKYLPNITHLYLNDNKISDFTDLENLTELYGLYVFGNDEDTHVDRVLRNNKQLYSLGIDDTQLTDYSILAEMVNLNDLVIHGISNIDYSAVGKLTKLQSLDLSYNYDRDEYGKPIGNISFLPQMTDLQYLYLNGVTMARELKYIMQLPNLTTLYLYNCDITSNPSAMKDLTQALPNCAISY